MQIYYDLQLAIYQTKPKLLKLLKHEAHVFTMLKKEIFIFKKKV